MGASSSPPARRFGGMQSASPAGFVGAYRKETKHFCSLLNAMDGLLVVLKSGCHRAAINTHKLHYCHVGSE